MLYDIIKRSYKRWFFNFKENMISRGIFLVISCGEKGKASYLLIFSTDFIFFAQSSFSIPHKWQKDTFWALAHFLARFLSISAVWTGMQYYMISGLVCLKPQWLTSGFLFLFFPEWTFLIAFIHIFFSIGISNWVLKNMEGATPAWSLSAGLRS